MQGNVCNEVLETVVLLAASFSLFPVDFNLIL